MTEWIATVLIVIGTAFSALAAVGVWRMPDLYMRMQAAAKSSTVGVSCLILAAAIQFEPMGATTRALLVVAFLFLTGPVAAHMVARAAYAAGVELWSKSVLDELRDHTADQQKLTPSPSENASPPEARG